MQYALHYLFVFFITIFAPLHASDTPVRTSDPKSERFIPIASTHGWVEISRKQNKRQCTAYLVASGIKYINTFRLDRFTESSIPLWFGIYNHTCYSNQPIQASNIVAKIASSAPEPKVISSAIAPTIRIAVDKQELEQVMKISLNDKQVVTITHDNISDEAYTALNNALQTESPCTIQ